MPLGRPVARREDRMDGLHRKEIKTADELVAHMRGKGVSFDRLDERSAARYLKEKNNYFRVGSFRKLFQKSGDAGSGERYVSLDFGDLVQLSYVDQTLRSTLRAMSLDVEHYEKVAIIDRIAEDAAEDGYTVVRDYKASLPGERLSSLEGELDRKSRDIYCGSLISKYKEDMPVWAFLEVASFGTFLGFCLFCSERWDDASLRDLYFMLLKAKSIRNAASHGACILNGFAEKDGNRRKTPRKVWNALSATGVSAARKGRWMDNPRMRDVATLAYLYAERVPDGSAKEATRERLALLYQEGRERLASLPPNNPAVAGLRFMESLTDGLALG